MQIAFGARCAHCSHALQRQAGSLLSDRYWTKFGTANERIRHHSTKNLTNRRRSPYTSTTEGSTSTPTPPSSFVPPPLPILPSTPPAGYANLEYPKVTQSRFDFKHERQRRAIEAQIVPQETKTIEKEHAAGLTDLISKEQTKNPASIFLVIAGWLLRHQARNFGYGVAPDGFVRLSDFLRFPAFRSYTAAKVAHLVQGDLKDRFEMTQLPDFLEGAVKEVWWIRARMKHSIPGVTTHSKRILHLAKMRVMEYRTEPKNWDYILKHGIPEDAEHVIRLHTPLAKDLFEESIPRQQKLLCVTLDAEVASKMGVMFYHTKDVKTYASGTREKGVIPIEACRSAVIMDLSKETLR